MTNDAFGRPHVAPPVVEDFCGTLLRHGERDTTTQPGPAYACLCGAPEYLLCKRYLDGEGFIGGATVYRSQDDGTIQVAMPAASEVSGS